MKEHPIKYHLGQGSSDALWHVLGTNLRPICGSEGPAYERRWYGFHKGFLSYASSRYCERCGQIDAHNGLPPVSQENVTNRETTSEGARSPEWVYVTRYSNPDRNTHSLGLSSGGTEYPVSSMQYNQLGSSSISRIEQAVNTEEAARSRSHRTRVFYRAIEDELTLLRADEARVQRERPASDFRTALRNYSYPSGNW